MRKAFFAAIFMLGQIGGAAHASQDEFPPAVTEALESAGIPTASAAIYVQPVDGAKPLLSINANVPESPASTMKLVTTYAALQILGPAYNWKTEVYAEGKLKGDTLIGDLVIKGYGDPKLTLENFWLLLRSLRERGLKTIRGDLVLDRSFFAPQREDPASFDSEPYRAYNVGPDPLLLNFKVIQLRFIPQPERKRVLAIADPLPAGIEIDNQLAATTGACDDWSDKLRREVETTATTVRITLTGAYPANCGENIAYVSVLDHPQYVFGVFRQLWQEMGGTLSGGLREAELSASAQLLASSASPPLGEVIRDMNKTSNNVIARQLFLTLGANGSAATAERAVAAIKAWLASKGLDFPELQLENGSGRSRVERISAAHMGQLLVDAYRSPVMPEFVASLPIAGVDGTMKKRLNGGALAGRAHIKTGTLDNVKAAAGYLLDARGRTMAFVFFINDLKASGGQASEDALLEWLYQRP